MRFICTRDVRFEKLKYENHKFKFNIIKDVISQILNDFRKLAMLYKKNLKT